jgi:hypothetical protein
VGLVHSPFKDLRQHLQWQLISGESDDIKREQGTSPHRIEVRKGIRGCDLPELVRIIHDGRKEIDTLDDQAAIFQTECGGIVGSIVSDENTVVGGQPRQLTQNLGQVLRTQLAGSTGAVTELCQALMHLE